VTEHSSSQRTDSRDDDHGSVEITKEQLREILAECTGTGLASGFDDATPLVLDSYVTTWIRQLLEDRLGAVVELTPDVADSLDTVAALHAFVNQAGSFSRSPEHAPQDQP